MKRMIMMLFVLYTVCWLSAQSLIQEEQDFTFASQLAEKGMYDLAAVQFSRYAETYPLSPKAPEAMFKAAVNFEKADSLGKAASTYMSLLLKFPDSRFIDRAIYNRAAILSNRGEHRDAAVTFSRLYLFLPESELVPDAQIAACREYLKINDLKSAAESVDILLEKFSTHPLRLEARYLLAEIQRRQNQPSLALGQLDRILSDRVNDELAVKARYLRAKIFEQMGKYTLADSVLYTIVNSGAKMDTIYAAGKKLARTLFDRGQCAKSIDVIQKILALEPADPFDFLSLLCDNYYMLENYDAALSALQKIQPNSLDNSRRIGYEFRMGKVRGQLKEYAYALENYLQTITYVDTIKSLQMLKHESIISAAKALVELNRPGEAVRRLQNYINADQPVKHIDEILYQMGQIQEEHLKDYFGARQNYSSISSLSYKSQLSDDTILGVARTFETEGNYSLAIGEYNRYFQLYPGADDYDRIEKRVDYLRKFKLVRSDQAQNALNNMMAQNMLGASPARMLLDWAKQQITIFHDYKKALASLKKIIGKGQEDVQEEELFYLMALCHARLADYYLVNKQSTFSTHLDTLNKTLSYLTQNFPESRYIPGIWYELTRLQLSVTEEKSQKIEILENSIGSSIILPDSLDNSLKYLLLKELVHDRNTFNPANVTRAKNLAKDITAIRSPLAGRAFFLEGVMYLWMERPDSAANLIQRVINEYSLSPDVVKAYFILADIHDLLGLWNEAERLYTVVSEQYYYSKLAPYARERLMNMLVRQGKSREAIKRYKQLETQVPREFAIYFSGASDDEMLWFFAQAQMQEDKPNEALYSLKRYLLNYPNGKYRKEALNQAGELANQLNHLDMALGYFEELIRTFPKDSLAQSASVRAGDIYYDRGLFDKALSRYIQVGDSVHQDLKITSKAKQILCEYKLGNVVRASAMAEQFEREFNNAPYQAEFLYEEGLYYLNQKDFKEAEKTFRLLSKRYDDIPAGGRGELGLARMYVITNKTEDALKSLTKIPEKYQDPEIVATAYLNLGDFYYENRQDENCILACVKVLDLREHGPLRARAIQLLVDAYDNLGMRDRAISLLREYIEMYPGDPEILQKKIRVGVLLYYLKDYDRAIAHLRQLKPLVSDEDEPRVQYWIAKSYADHGNREQAIVEFLKVKYLSKPGKLPYGATALYEAAMEYRKLGNLTKAKELLQQVVRERGTSDNIGQAASMKIREIDAEMQKI
ncbi:tetratricopeptide repeat protein [candidate division KSB1 bacterium]|nr:tetratricopeptide repeat protein [candidate division KSB1 bacterium]